MCRVIVYMGPPVLMEDLLYEPELALVKQTYASKMSALLNLAGFGMSCWSEDYATPPLIYKTIRVPIYDPNLKNLAKNLSVTKILAHIRGIGMDEYDDLLQSNLHPFHMEGTPLVLAHNGFIKHFNEMKQYLTKYIRPEILKNVRGRTDSEWMYGVFLSQFPTNETSWSRKDTVEAVLKTLDIFRLIRRQHNIDVTSTANLFISNGDWLVATRFAFDFGCYEHEPDFYDLNYISLWFSMGECYSKVNGEYRIKPSKNQRAFIVASEPLTHDVSTWSEVPEYSLLQIYKDGENYKSEILSIEI